MIAYEKHHSSSMSYLYRQYDENLQFQLHFHDSFELIYVYEGEVTVNIEKEVYSIKKGQGLLVLPNQIHSYTTNEYSKTFILIFASSYVAKYYKHSCLYCSKTPYFDLTNQKGLIENLENSNDLYLQKSLLYYIVHLYMQGESIARDSKYNTLMQRILTYIDGHYQEKITLKILALDLGYDYHYLSSIINSALSSNFLTYLNEYRINKICEIMMDDSQTPINELAYSSGYSSLRTFNRNFIRLKKMTPIAYRHKLIHDK